jgi:hypothetical protein
MNSNAPKARGKGESGAYTGFPSRPPWGIAKSTVPPGKRPYFKEVLNPDALGESAKGKFGGVFGPYPREVRRCRALLGVEGKWMEEIVETAKVETEGGGEEMALAPTEQFHRRIRALREECKDDERHSRALIILGDRILTGGRAPAIANVALREIVKELFSAPSKMDTRCAIAFLCRVQVNFSYMVGEKPIMQQILEGEWGIGGTPAFFAVARRLLEDSCSENETESRWASECCSALSISEGELGELVGAIEGLNGPWKPGSGE